MQRTAHLNWLGKLTAVAVLTSGLAQAATMSVAPNQVDWNQDGLGTDVRIRYDAASDNYYLNVNTTTPWVSGIAGSLYGGSSWQRVYEGGTTYYITRADQPNMAQLIWEFDFGTLPITAATIINSSFAWADAGHAASVAWSVSTNGGSSWSQYNLIQTGTTGLATDGGAINDLTPYVAGKTNFLVKADLYSLDYTYYMNEQIFRTNAGAEWGYGHEGRLGRSRAGQPRPAGAGRPVPDASAAISGNCPRQVVSFREKGDGRGWAVRRFRRARHNPPPKKSVT